MASKEWYLSKGEKRIGPLSVSQIERRAERGKLPRGTLLWREGMEEALPVAEVDLGVALAEPPKKKSRPKRSARSGRRKTPLSEAEAAQAGVAEAPKKKRSKKKKGVTPPATQDLGEPAAEEPATEEDLPVLDMDEIAVAEPARDENYLGRIELPPISEEVSHLGSASLFVKLKNAFVTVFAFAFLGGLLYLPAMLFQIGWLEITAYAVAGLGALLGLGLAFTTKVADCPSCGGLLGTKTGDNLSGLDHQEIVECRHCYELLLSHEGEVTALGHEDAPKKQKKGLEAPVFKGGCWRDECVVCGDVVDHTEEASKTKVELAQLLVGTLSVASASIKDIPYCAQHSGEVSITIRDEHPRLVFRDLDARRRYVHLNRDCEPAKV